MQIRSNSFVDRATLLVCTGALCEPVPLPATTKSLLDARDGNGRSTSVLFSWGQLASRKYTWALHCQTWGTVTGGLLESYLGQLASPTISAQDVQNTCGNYIVDFGSYSLWSNCGRILSILAPILGTTFLSGPFAAQCQLRTPLIQLISLFSSTMSGRSPHVMFNLGGIHACLGTHVSVDHMWRNMQLGCFADGKYCWYGYGYVGLEKYRLWVTSIQGQCSQWYLVGNTTILVSLMCISYIHTIPQFSFNTILLLHFKFTTIKHVYEQGCMENIHNRRFDGCEILEKQISACLFTIQDLVALW